MDTSRFSQELPSTPVNPYVPQPRPSQTSPSRSQSNVKIFYNLHDEITRVKIGYWRELSASSHRRIAEVRELPCDRVAVKIEISQPGRLLPLCTVWELYNHRGQLLSMLQDIHEKSVCLITDFQSGRVHESQFIAAN